MYRFVILIQDLCIGDTDIRIDVKFLTITLRKFNKCLYLKVYSGKHFAGSPFFISTWKNNIYVNKGHISLPCHRVPKF